MFVSQNRLKNKKTFRYYSQKSGIYFISILLLFIVIGGLTTIKPAYRFSSEIITKWTSDIDSSAFLYLLSMENRAFHSAYPKDKVEPNFSTIFFQVITNIKPDDPRSLLGQEIPGFSSFGNKIIMAGEGTNHMTLSIESSPPLEDVLKEREAVWDDADDSNDDEIVVEKDNPNNLTTGDRDVVFIYNSHNYESFLPHLPDVTDSNKAHHKEVNITKVSDRLAKKLNENGIGSYVDKTDTMKILNQNGWGYGRSYQASRTAVAEAVSTNKDLTYIFDIHRDSVPRELSTTEINGESYAMIYMVVGSKYDSYEKNLSLAVQLNQLIEEKYPGLSRGVIEKGDPGSNGVYNQDLSENALLMEFGGYENTLDELYRTADVIADVFSDFYWDAEKVDSTIGDDE